MFRQYLNISNHITYLIDNILKFNLLSNIQDKIRGMVNMNKIILACLLIVTIIAVSGCTDTPNVNIETSWDGLKGELPYLFNDMKTSDSRSIEVIVENEDQSTLDGIVLRISSNIPDFRITPDYVTVMKLGPKGTSKSESSIFTIESFNTPPGEYSFLIYAEYGGKRIKSEKVSVDIG